MTRLERDLADLKHRVLDMGNLAASMVTDSWHGVARNDAACRSAVAAHEPALDRTQLEIDREAVRLIAIFAPVARDLRFLLMIARITSELERMGDQAVDNCEYAALIGAAPPTADLTTLADFVQRMVRDALQAFADEDPRQAEAVMQLDAQVDALYSQVFRDLIEHAGGSGRARSTGLILLARSLERIADHATNICEEVFYLVEGADIRHQDAVKA
ncbi:MAG TPA: phosphate signaling complex protein PhoU [Vicinamibacterales bacterium]|nr:phosphate signaling complex protein PhoU [Vicinamibacterales bacterium]